MRTRNSELMFQRFRQLLLILFAVVLGYASALAQGSGADGRPLYGDDRDLPIGARETRAKMQIEQSKKDHDEMLRRGDEVRRLSERLERSFELNGKLTDEDRPLLDSLEKNVKKIREELGGDDGDEKIEEILGPETTPSSSNAIGKLKNAAIDLVDELNKTTRFSISATAIQTSNTVLTVARFLRIRK